MLRAEAAQPVGHYDVVHSHYWLSGQVGALARDRWGVPLVHSMHTMAKVKNDALADGDTPEPVARIIGEEQVVEAADMLIANTDLEAKQLIDLYDADPGRVEVVHPGVDLDVFRPAGPGRGARRRSGCPRTPSSCCSPAGSSRSRRPTCCCARSRVLLEREPELRSRLVVPSSAARPAAASSTPRRWPSWPPSSASTDVVRFVPPVAQAELARWYAAATAGRRAVLQRVVRPGRRRGAGDRHAGRRRRRRRADHGGPRRAQRPAGRRPRRRTTGPTRCAGSSTDDDAARPARGRRARAGPAVLLGAHRRARRSRSTSAARALDPASGRS